MADTKKVLFFLVEGPTDEGTLSAVMKRIFDSQAVHFQVVHGDITTEQDISGRNAKKHVAERISVEMKKYGYQKTDILRVVHLIDTDGAFIPDSAVYECAAEGICYFEDHIETKYVSSVRKRNAKKAQVIATLSRTGKILRDVPYSIFYFSRNMEHVLHNRSEELSDEDKIDLADAFAEQYENDIPGFLTLIRAQDIAVPGNYTETWRFIYSETNSLGRHSNFHLLFPQEAPASK